MTKSELFKSSMENLEWYKENYENIRKDCDNQWVVIQNKKIVAKASTYENITRTLTKEDRESAIIEYIDSNPLAMFF